MTGDGVAAQSGEKFPVLIIMHGERSSAGRIGQILEARGHTLDIRKPRFGCDLPKTLAQHAGAVIFGGPMSSNDPDDYIRAEIDFIGIALKEQKPFFGVCLGAQMLAMHLGARVAPHPGGKVEIGYVPVLPTDAGARLGPWPTQVYQWHREGFDLPTGSTQLASGTTYENQAFAYGPAAIGVQFHPEITYGLVNRWTIMAKDWQLRDGAQDRDRQFAAHLLHGAAVATWLDGVLDGWLANRPGAGAA